MTQEMLSNTIIQDYEGLIAPTRVRHSAAKCCVSFLTELCQSIFMLFQSWVSQAKAINLAEACYILKEVL